VKVIEKENERERERQTNIERESDRKREREISPISRNPRTYFREQISRLEIRELNLILPVPVPENGNGKIKKLTSNQLTSRLIISIDTPKTIFSISYGVGNHS
jgi:hypothetical protein